MLNKHDSLGGITEQFYFVSYHPFQIYSIRVGVVVVNSRSLEEITGRFTSSHDFPLLVLCLSISAPLCLYLQKVCVLHPPLGGNHSCRGRCEGKASQLFSSPSSRISSLVEAWGAAWATCQPLSSAAGEAISRGLYFSLTALWTLPWAFNPVGWGTAVHSLASQKTQARVQQTPPKMCGPPHSMHC